eukprot:TRINITY_DN32649_c0_g1_i1.p2 TRINITY_DN32649_c0_g1~~TRINITY_DN32649_c0_g1_i1.p2  ORF type:complete len:292 (+),score=104.35 TRINITY_DN32649_c0_g1_i1:87-962(+)
MGRKKIPSKGGNFKKRKQGKDDKDIIKMPLPDVFGMAPMIPLAAEKGKKAAAKAAPKAAAEAKKKRRGKKNRRAGSGKKKREGDGDDGSGSDEEGDEDGDDGDDDDSDVPRIAGGGRLGGALDAGAKLNLKNAPKRQPGESATVFARRVDAWTETNLREVRKKSSTVNAKEKRKKAREAKKARVDKKKAVKTGVEAEDNDGLFRKADKVAFGDVVNRPPILDQTAKKSRAKLDALKAKVGGGKDGPGLAGIRSGEHLKAPNKKLAELEAYASKVKDAYAAMKKKRKQTKDF